MSHNKALLLIGGPADGQRLIVSASARIHNTCEHGLPDNEDGVHDAEQQHRIGSSPAKIHTYAIQAVQGAGHEVYSVGVMDLSVCIQHALVAGYRKPKAHDSDMNVAEHLVTLLGGEKDGQQVVVNNMSARYISRYGSDIYHIIALPCKNGTEIRVGVTDPAIDPLPILLAGYRFGVPA